MVTNSEVLMLRWGDNIRMDLREIEWEAFDWMHLGQDTDKWRVVIHK
jgi:hypothetical protein